MNIYIYSEDQISLFQQANGTALYTKSYINFRLVLLYFVNAYKEFSI